MMQDYMILRKDARRVETGTGDRVIRDFRNRMEERQQEAASRYGTIRALGTLCGVLSVAVLAGGVVLFGITRKCARWRVCWYAFFHAASEKTIFSPDGTTSSISSAPSTKRHGTSCCGSEFPSSSPTRSPGPPDGYTCF